MDPEVRALKIEIAETILRKIGPDRRPGDHMVATMAVAMVLCDVISSSATCEEHRQSLIRITEAMLQACTTVREKK